MALTLLQLLTFRCLSYITADSLAKLFRPKELLLLRWISTGFDVPLVFCVVLTVTFGQVLIVLLQLDSVPEFFVIWSWF